MRRPRTRRTSRTLSYTSIPKSFFDAFATGDLLQVLLVAVLTAFAISAMGERGQQIAPVIDQASHVFFGIMRIIV